MLKSVLAGVSGADCSISLQKSLVVFGETEDCRCKRRTISDAGWSLAPIWGGGTDMPFTLTRDQLYELVWSEAMQKLARQIGISDVAIAKNCRKAGIPVPERGYWNKAQAGKSVTKVALPPADLGTVSTIVMSGELPPQLEGRITGKPGEQAAQEDIDILAERFQKRLGKVSTPRGLDPAHPQIAALLARDEERRRKREASSFSWPEPRFESPFERRRLRILNGIFLAVARAGGDGWVRGDYAREIGLRFGDRNTMFTLEHTGKQSRPGYSPSPPPEGIKSKMRLRVGTTHNMTPNPLFWEDKEGCPLEDQLADIIVGLAVDAEQAHRAWLLQRIAWAREVKELEEKEARARKEAEERRERERLAAIERAKIDKLLEDAASWHKAAEIRAYVDAVRADSSNLPECETWAAWALAEADKLDPIKSKCWLPSTNANETLSA